MRALVTALILALPLSATAEPLPPVAIEPFRGRCFDAAQLALRLRDQLPSATVWVGASASSRYVVRVREEGERLVVEVAQRGAGTQQRTVPVAAGCEAALQATTLIVARAALPLFTPASPRPPHPPAAPKHEPHRTEPEPAPTETPTPTPTPTPTETPTRTPTPTPTPTRTPTPTPTLAPTMTPSKPPPERAAPPTTRVTRPSLPPRRRQLELDVRAAWAFPLDGPPSAPAGELAIGYSFRRGVGLSVRAGVEGENTLGQTTSTGTQVAIATRRLPLGVEVHYDVRIPSGAIRLGAGPMVALWLAHSSGIPQPASSTLAEPGASVRLAYRLDLKHLSIAAGAVLDALFTAHDLQIGGAGTIARTSLVELTPFVSLGGQIF